MLCTQLPGGAPEDEFTELLVDRGVSGIVFVSGLHADTTARMDRYTRLTDRGLPIVLVDGYSEHIDAPFISPDDRMAARLAVQHLVDLGHERIGLALGPRRFVPVIRKIEGYRQAMAPAPRRGRAGRPDRALAVLRRGRAGRRGPAPRAPAAPASCARAT
ncbi:hypothetical protein GCM10020220_000680 [Nonomuraea rubra]|uniref:hypothetical protein n=1 Tax=Nonomuraea rubra TaxID=46180 RepID=UPI00336E5641